MWLFEAKYVNMDNGKKVTRKISFDGDNFFKKVLHLLKFHDRIRHQIKKGHRKGVEVL